MRYVVFFILLGSFLISVLTPSMATQCSPNKNFRFVMEGTLKQGRWWHLKTYTRDKKAYDKDGDLVPTVLSAYIEPYHLASITVYRYNGNQGSIKPGNIDFIITNGSRTKPIVGWQENQYDRKPYIIIFPIKNYRQKVDLVAGCNVSGRSDYYIKLNSVNLINITIQGVLYAGGQVLVEEIIKDAIDKALKDLGINTELTKENSTVNAMVGRAVTVLASKFQGRNFEGVTLDLFLNEVTGYIEREFGGNRFVMLSVTNVMTTAFQGITYDFFEALRGKKPPFR